jgi:hypothetical protein
MKLLTSSLPLLSSQLNYLILAILAISCFCLKLVDCLVEWDIVIRVKINYVSRNENEIFGPSLEVCYECY